jgi:hypothetical protein
MELSPSWGAVNCAATFQHFMEPEGSLPCSQDPTTGPYPEPDRQSIPSQTISLRSISILPACLRLGFPSGLFLLLSHQYSICIPLLTIHATSPAHLIILIMPGEQYKSWGSSLCSFLQSPATSSLFSPNIFLSYPVLKHPLPAFLPQYQRSSFTQI